MSDDWRDIADLPLHGEFEIMTRSGLIKRARPSCYSEYRERGRCEVWGLLPCGKWSLYNAKKWRPIQENVNGNAQSTIN